MDFVDMSELVLDEVESDVEDDHEEREQIKRRGKDINWVLEDHYSNENNFMDSEFKNEMDKELTRKKRYRTNDSWAEHWVCKYLNKRGYLPCPRQLKVQLSCDLYLFFFKLRLNPMIRWSHVTPLMTIPVLLLSSDWL